MTARRACQGPRPRVRRDTQRIEVTPYQVPCAAAAEFAIHYRDGVTLYACERCMSPASVISLIDGAARLPDWVELDLDSIRVQVNRECDALAAKLKGAHVNADRRLRVVRRRMDPSGQMRLAESMRAFADALARLSSLNLWRYPTT